MRNPRYAFISATASGAALLASMVGCTDVDANAAQKEQVGTTRQAASTFYDTGFNTGKVWDR